MGKVKVKLVNSSNHIKDDSGKYFEPHKVYTVEESDRIKQCIAQNLLERIRDNSVKSEPPAEEEKQESQAPPQQPTPK